MGSENWQIDAFLRILKDEIAARESCQFMSKTNRGENLEFVLACAFCNGNHFLDKCTVVSEMAERKRMVKENTSG